MRQPGDDEYVEEHDELDDDLAPLGEVLAGLDADWSLARKQAAIEAMSRVRSPAYVADAEKQVIGAALIDPVATMTVVEELGLQPTDFYSPRLREIWTCIASMFAKGKPITTISVVDELNRLARLDRVGGASTLSGIEAGTGLAAVGMVKSNAMLIAEKARLRSIMAVCGTALERCKLGDATTGIVDDVLTSLSGIASKRSSENIADLAAVARNVLAALPGFGGSTPGMSTGFPDVDYLFRPGPGDLIIVAARPSMGKTAWVLDLLKNVAVRRCDPAMIFSLEMSSEQLVTRMVASHSGIESRKMRLTSSESTRIHTAASEIVGSPLIIDETPAISIGELKSRARAVSRRMPLSLIAVDYIQLVTPSRVSDNRATDVGEISAGLKALGRELRCPVVALSQLNRGVETRTDRRPLMSDLRESGSIEQDADVVAFLYREEYYAKDRCPPDKRGVAEFIVSKNRNGPTGTATLHFNASLPRFDSLARP